MGLGRAALHHHLPHIATLPGVEIVGGSDPVEDARRQARKAGVPECYASVDELLRKARPDVVNVCTPPELHAQQCIAALKAGAHVFCEKPFVTSLEEADAVIDASRAAGRQVAVNNQYRRMAVYSAAQAEIGSARFGDLLFVRASALSYRTPATEGGWRGKLKRRTLFEFGTHVLDLVRFMYGADPIAVHASMPPTYREFDADLVNIVTLTFPGRCSASIVLNRVHHGGDRYLDMGLDGARGSIEISLDHVRQRAQAWLERERGASRELLAEDTGHPWGQATGRHFARFVESIERGQAPETSAADNRVVLAACLAAYDSAERGEVVHLSERGGRA